MFALSASSTTRVAVSARAPVKAQRTTVASAFANPAARKASSSACLALKPRANGAAALKASAPSSVSAKAVRSNFAVFAGRFESERTYIMIKPDGVQRGYVSTCIRTNPTREHTRHARNATDDNRGGKKQNFILSNRTLTDWEAAESHTCRDVLLFLFSLLFSF